MKLLRKKKPKNRGEDHQSILKELVTVKRTKTTQLNLNIEQVIKQNIFNTEEPSILQLKTDFSWKPKFFKAKLVIQIVW